MAEQIRDAVIALGGAWPVIGGGVVVVAVLGWLAHAAHAGGEEGLTWLLGAAAAGAFIAVAVSFPVAREACRDLWVQDVPQYWATKCEVLVQCDARTPTSFSTPSC